MLVLDLRKDDDCLNGTGTVSEGDVLMVVRRFFNAHYKKKSNGENQYPANPNDSLTLVPFLLLKIRAGDIHDTMI